MNTTYNNTPTVAVGLVVVYDDNIPLGIIGVERADGRGLALPGGYQERPETIEGAVSREVGEEVGLIFEVEDWDFMGMTTVPSGDVNLAFFTLATSVDYWNAACATFNPDDEVKSLHLIKPDSALAFPLHKTFVDRRFDQLLNFHAI